MRDSIEVAAFVQTMGTFLSQEWLYFDAALSTIYLLRISVFEEGIQNIHLFQLSLLIKGSGRWYGGLRLICDNVVR